MTLVFSGVKPNDAFCTRTLTLAKLRLRSEPGPEGAP
jgi:hypothetical protein